MTIDGKAETAQRSFGVINPATGDVFASAPDCTHRQLERALESAQKYSLVANSVKSEVVVEPDIFIETGK